MESGKNNTARGRGVAQKILAPVPALIIAFLLFFSSCAKKSNNATGPDIVAGNSLSGKVLENNAGLAGVSLLLTGSAGDSTISGLSASNGEYIFPGLPDGTYTLTPSKTDYLFIPPDATVTVEDGRTAVSNFAAEKLGLTFVPILAGSFRMGDETGDLKSDCLPVHEVTLSGFEMSAFEITNAQYSRFLNRALRDGEITPSGTSVNGAEGEFSGKEYLYLAGADASHPEARCWISYRDSTFSVEPGRETWPVIWVTWYGAKAYALYYGLDLPTEAEWEYACRGGKQFKYGTDTGELSVGRANYSNSGIDHPVAVGSYPKNPFGLADMSGNVWEWCCDWYGPYPDEAVTNPTGASAGTMRVIRGGGWSFYSDGCRSAYRYTPKPSYRYYSLGFRVVRR